MNVPSSIKKVLFLSDWQIPYQIDFEPIYKFMADFKPDIITLAGDMLDLEGLQGYWEKPVEAINWTEIFEEIRIANEMLDRIDKISPKAEKHWWMGNHEERLHKFRKANPAYCRKNSKLPYLIEDLKLKERKYKIHWQNDLVPFGKLHIFHGLDYNDSHAKKTLMANEVNVAYGHVHDAQRYTKVSRIDSQPKSAWSLGCLCNRNPEWKNGEPNRWVNGFAVFFVQPNGNFNLYPIDIIDGSFVGPNGVLYKTDKKPGLPEWAKKRVEPF